MNKTTQEIDELSYNGLSYGRQRKDGSFPRGTVHLYHPDTGSLSRQIMGFPSIKRVYRLQPGIKRLFKKMPFWAEEKLDGYNLRIFMHEGNLLAATRGGFICPFSTDWAQIWAQDNNLNHFFRDHPQHILCGEVLGDNPYNLQRHKDLPEGAHFFVFEICAPDGSFLPVETKQDLVRQYQLPAAPSLGKFDTSQRRELYSLLRDLNFQGKEGVVLKSEDSTRLMKFVTPECDIQDIKDGLRVGFDLDMGFFQSRYMRIGFFVQELGLDQEEYARKLGRAFLEGIPTTGDFKGAQEEYTIYLSQRSTWEALRTMLMSQVKIRCLEISPQEIQGRDMLKIRFARIYTRSSKRYQKMIQGYLHQD